jgi:hypothetical protein
MEPNPAWSSLLSVGKLSCQMKTITQIAMIATVTIGNREVGLLSFSGSIRQPRSLFAALGGAAGGHLPKWVDGQGQWPSSRKGRAPPIPGGTPT